MKNFHQDFTAIFAKNDHLRPGREDFYKKVERIRLKKLSILVGGGVMLMFEKLEVYRKALDPVNQTISLSEGLPKGYYSPKDQLIRAALSVSTNIAEGNGRWHKRDKHNFFEIARGSCFECVPILQILKTNGSIDPAAYDNLIKNLEKISKMISGLIKNCDIRN